MTRQRKTPAQRAQEQYDVACRVVERLAATATKARAEADKLQAEYAEAVARRDYLAGHPDLPKRTAIDASIRTAAETAEPVEAKARSTRKASR